MSNAHQISERPCSLRHRMTFSNWMKSGASCRKKRIHDGCGQPCADGLARLWPLPLVTEAKPPAFVYGRAFQRNTSTAIRSVIFGQPISRSSLQRPIVVSEKKRERQHIENDGTTPYVNELVAAFDKRCPFPNLMSIMR